MIRRIIRLKKLIYILSISMFAMILNACSLVEISQQTEIVDNYVTVNGKITVTLKQNSDASKIVVVLLKQSKDFLLKKVDYVLADNQGNFHFRTEPGNYLVGAFVDINDDKMYQENELGEIYGTPTLIKLVARQSVQINISITGKFTKRIAYDRNNDDQTSLSLKNIGKVVSLKDEMFMQKNGSFGLWYPIDFLKKYGAGLFLLQNYSSNKIPIIFVHGANGTSIDWKMIIEKLDMNHFQPWLLYYPSGLSLDDN